MHNRNRIKYKIRRTMYVGDTCRLSYANDLEYIFNIYSLKYLLFHSQSLKTILNIMAYRGNIDAIKLLMNYIVKHNIIFNFQHDRNFIVRMMICRDKLQLLKYFMSHMIRSYNSTINVDAIIYCVTTCDMPHKGGLSYQWFYLLSQNYLKINASDLLRKQNLLQ